jgi:argininosuccinate lyase
MIAGSMARKARFRKDPDPRFWRLNRSLEFDWQLAIYDLDQSRAHARGLRGIGVLDAGELERMIAGLDGVQERMAAHGFAFEDSDEDIHMAIERLLGEEIGPLAGKLHTGRSRNDQVATDVAMVVQNHSLNAIELCGDAMERLLTLAETHRDWPMPGYTHLQRAQPVYLGHHLLAYFWMLARDVLRFQFALDSASVMPLGSGALAGVNWEIDRDAVAADLGFDHVSHNSIDGASNRDFVLDYLAAASACSMHLSRLGSEIVIWSSTEFGFCLLDESFSSGSSIMPQKVNPDSAELLRAKSPRVAASYATLLGVMHALPLTYGKDMQEDKEPLFDAIDTVEACLDAAAGMLAGIEFDRARLEEASGDEMLAATEVADLLVRKGVPFREAHGIVGAVVRDAVERGVALSELTPAQLREHSEQLDDSFYEVLQRGSWLESKRIAGGTGSVPLAAQLGEAAETLAAVRARVREERS